VSPQPRLSPLFRRLLWGVRETKNGAYVTRVTITYLGRKCGPTSENSVKAKFAEFNFYEVG
jgi:hypothetical protein